MEEYWNQWIRTSVAADEVERVAEFGKLLGMKSKGEALYGSNFERGLLLRQILREKRPERVLELGTGRGFGTICMADCAVAENLDCVIETVDFIPGDQPQKWPLEKNGTPVYESRALGEFWAAEFPALSRKINRHHGATTDILTALGKQKAAFDFIFVDAAHDLRSVFLDLTGALSLITPGGCILMDDFAPLESFGLATCIAAHHAGAFFTSVEIVRSEGVVYPSRIPPSQRRSMVFLDQRNDKKISFSPSAIRVLGLRAAGKLLDWLYSPAAFRV